LVEVKNKRTQNVCSLQSKGTVVQMNVRLIQSSWRTEFKEQERTRKKVHALAFCKRCRHHGKMGFLCKKCDDGMNMYMIDGMRGWRHRIIRYNHGFGR